MDEKVREHLNAKLQSAGCILRKTSSSYQGVEPPSFFEHRPTVSYYGVAAFSTEKEMISLLKKWAGCDFAVR
ncbi:hypothetical protein ACQUKI_16140 [Ralstonia pseudosolanacearum]